MKCSFCGDSEEMIKMTGGKLIVVKSKREVSICNVCVGTAKSGKMTDVNNLQKNNETVIFLGDDDDA